MFQETKLTQTAVQFLKLKIGNQFLVELPVLTPQKRCNKRGLSCAKLSQQSTRFLGPMELSFFWFELLMVQLLNR